MKYLLRNRLNFGLAGALIGSAIIGAGSTALANKQAGDAAADSRAHSDYQMKNKHQWEVEDLKKAGLNPILSAHGSGSTGSSAMANVRPMGEGVASAVSSAIQAKKAKAEVDLLYSQKDLNDQKSFESAEASKLLSKQSAKTHYEAEITKNRKKGSDLEGEIDSGKHGRMSRILSRYLPFMNTSAKYSK